MPTSSADIIRYASDSGFPLQIAVQHAVDENVSKTGWNVRYVEHGWVHRRERQRGFIDLVLHAKRGELLFVVECKRQREAAWVFMHYSGKAIDRRHAKPWITHVHDNNFIKYGWSDLAVDPPCPEATFCALRGQTSAERNTLLERTGAELVLATEALASSERNFRRPQEETHRMYFPLVVTTASLKIADFEPTSVSLQDGELNDATVRDVPWVRLRKQLATRAVNLTPEDATGLGNPSYSLESSIFVVHCASLVDFLTQFEVPE
jgi:hypothetical protein